MIPLALAAIPAVVKGLSGIFQSRKGNKMARNNVRPDFEIPKEFQQNLAIAQNMAQTGMPQQQYNNAVNNIGRNQAGALRQFGRTGNRGSLASILRASNDATMNLDAQDAGARQNNQRFAIGQRGQMGQLQLQKQNWEKISKYEEDANAAAAMQGAGQQNKFGSLSSLSNLGQLGMTQGGFGGGGNSPTTTPMSTSMSPTVQSWMNNLTNPVQQGQYGTKLAGMSGLNSFGSNYKLPTIPPMKIMPKFIPKKY